MNYAIDYQVITASQVIVWDEGKDPEVLFLKASPRKENKERSGLYQNRQSKKKSLIPSGAAVLEKSEFINRLNQDDTVLLELGGASDRFALACMKRGAKVFHCPAYQVKQEKDRQGKKKAESASQILYRWYIQGGIGKFYPLREVDGRYLEIARIIKSYKLIQRKMRLPAQQRFKHLEQDLEFVGEDRVAEEVRNLHQLLIEVNLPDRLKAIEGKISRELKKRLEELPLHHEVFKPVQGVAEITAGSVIAGVLDIRRFKSLPAFRKMFGAHLVRNEKTGEWQRPVKQKGKQREGNPLLLEARSTFLQQQKMGNLDAIWQGQFEQRLAYEKTRVPELLQKEFARKGMDWPDDPKKQEALVFARSLARARVWLSQKFVQYIWHQWRKFEGISEE